TRRLLKGGHRVAVFDPRPEAVKELEGMGANGAGSLAELVGNLKPPRALWVMVPSCKITEDTIWSLAGILSAGDTVIDGGNSNYKDSQRRAEALKARGLSFIDVGTSGGIWGLAEGYSLMIGGEPDAVERQRAIFETLAPAPDKGWGRVGPSGAGHFVKMIHNGIEYGLMQAYAEGFEIMKAKTEFNLRLPQIAEIWRSGSVVRSWLLDLTARALAEDEDLRAVKAWVPDSGEGRWTVFEAIDLDVAAPVITAALQRRLRSRAAEPFSDKLLAALRNQFGGHAVKRVRE
ncbi:MAG: decarboxylating 6-phosphogluconate dehydrogenase, partial [Chloroflexi bacterium]|nr:decarboxylating 6-phosphogluconate dehydrogenase [Chloroflexota bacterium]